MESFDETAAAPAVGRRRATSRAGSKHSSDSAASSSSYTVNYAQFPQSLKVICVFETLEELTTFLESEQYNLLNIRVRRELTTLDVSLKPNVKIVVYDTEEMCEQEHQNNWAKRLATL